MSYKSFSVSRNSVSFIFLIAVFVLAGSYIPRLYLQFSGIYLIDLLVIPAVFGAVFIDYKKVFKDFKASGSRMPYLLFYGVPVLALLMGSVHGLGLSEQVPHLRTLSYFYIIFVLAKNIEFNKGRIGVFLFAGVIVLLAYYYFYLFHKEVILTEEYSNKYRLPFLLLLSVIVISFRVQSSWVAIPVFMFCAYLALLSNYRIYVFLLVLVMCLMYLPNGKWLDWVKKLASVGAAIIAIYVLGGVLDFDGYIYDFIYGDAARYSQLIAKTDLLLKGGAAALSSEQSLAQRFEHLLFAINNIFYFILPLGLGAGSIDSKTFLGYPDFNSIDGGILYGLLHYGALFFLIFLLFVFKYIRRFYRGLLAPDVFQFCASVFVISIYFFVTTEAFLIPELAICSGMSLGVMFNRSMWFCHK